MPFAYSPERQSMKKICICILVLLLTGCGASKAERDRHSLAFADFCMLEEDGMTVAVEVDGVSYTFTCSMHGDIVEVARTDGERFGIEV